MYLISLINIPLGYCRVNQRYVIDITDFMLVEILLCVLILIMAKGIFEVKLSKLQFVINQTEEAVKYIDDAKENFAQKNETILRLPRSISKKSLQKPKPSFSSDSDSRNVHQSFISNLAIQIVKASATSNDSSNFTLSEKSTADYRSINASLDSENAYESCGPALNNSSDNNKTNTGTDEKNILLLSTDTLAAPNSEISAEVNSNLPENKSKVSETEEGITSTGTYTIRFNVSKSSEISQRNSNTSKSSKSMPQVLNPVGSGEQQTAKVGNKSNVSKVSKSLSQGLNSPSNDQKLTPIKTLRNVTKSAAKEKTSKSKSQDLRVSQPKT